MVSFYVLLDWENILYVSKIFEAPFGPYLSILWVIFIWPCCRHSERMRVAIPAIFHGTLEFITRSDVRPGSFPVEHCLYDTVMSLLYSHSSQVHAAVLTKRTIWFLPRRQEYKFISWRRFALWMWKYVF